MNSQQKFVSGESVEGLIPYCDENSKIETKYSQMHV